MQTYIAGPFRKMAGRSTDWICTEPTPSGSPVIVSEKRLGDELSPQPNKIYIAEIASTAMNQRSRGGNLIASVEVIARKLVGALLTAPWERDDTGHPFVKGGKIQIPYGFFEVHYDNGLCPRGDHRSPRIWSFPCENVLCFDVMKRIFPHFICADEEVLRRARSAPPAPAGTVVEQNQEKVLRSFLIKYR